MASVLNPTAHGVGWHDVPELCLHQSIQLNFFYPRDFVCALNIKFVNSMNQIRVLVLAETYGRKSKFQTRFDPTESNLVVLSRK